MPHALVVSPHFDDAAMGAGHLLLGYVALGVILACRPELTGAGD